MRLGSFILALLAPFVTPSQGLDGGLLAHNQPGASSLAASILTLWRVIGPLAAQVDPSAPAVRLDHRAVPAAESNRADAALLLRFPTTRQQAALRPALPINLKFLLRC